MVTSQMHGNYRRQVLLDEHKLVIMQYMIAIRASPRFAYQGRPVLVAASLADLRGPTSGVVELPLRLYWSAPDRTFSLDDPAERQKVYKIVVREARRPDDLAVFP
jgi:hypothetical protein